MSKLLALLGRPGLLWTLVSHVRLATRLVREPRVPLAIKSVPVLVGLYVLSPIDLVPDLLPVLGQLDDLAIVAAGLELFVRICPPAAVIFHREAITGRRRYSPMGAADDVIDTTWHYT
jgi:uncharacterized membrane protein YkvA (DUF1232 family)